MTVTVVAGPPCSGKSTYVREHAAPGDVVIDWDVLAQAFGSPVEHGHANQYGELANVARSAALDVVMHTRGGPDFNVWVIHSSPTAEQVQTYRRRGARFVCVDPGKDVCLERAAADDRPATTYASVGRWYGMAQPARTA